MRSGHASLSLGGARMRVNHAPLFNQEAFVCGEAMLRFENGP